jgi:hypothetical protein
MRVHASLRLVRDILNQGTNGTARLLIETRHQGVGKKGVEKNPPKADVLSGLVIPDVWQLLPVKARKGNRGILRTIEGKIPGEILGSPLW